MTPFFFQSSNKNLGFLSNQKGSTLIQVMITGGLIAILALTMASLFAQQNKQIKLMEQKSETLDIKNEILMSLSDQVICGCNLNPSKLAPLGSLPAITFNASPANLDLSRGLRKNCDSTTTPFLISDKKMFSGLEIDTVHVAGLEQISGGLSWMGHLEISFKNTSMKIKNLSLPLRAETSVDGSGNYQVETCTLGGSNPNSKIPGRQVFETSGTFVVPDGITLVRVTVIGGGGGGGHPVSCGGADLAGGGGGGGEVIYSKDIPIPVGVASVPVTIGAGGIGGSSSASVGGTAGGNSSFGSYAIAHGGQGAPAGSWASGCVVAFKEGAAGGSGGSPGQSGVSASWSLNVHRKGGNGGGTLLGAGGPSIYPGYGKSSANPSGYGGGGGGGEARNTGGGGTAMGVGDDGGSGVVIVEW